MSYQKSSKFGDKPNFVKQQYSQKRNYENHTNDEETEDVNEEKSSKTGYKRAKVYHMNAKLKQWRLIVRNLPFKTNVTDVQNACSKIGCFNEVVLPPSKKMPGKCAGFAFVQFLKQEDAEKGKEWFNNNKFLGRMVAADWALDRDSYETAAHEEKQKMKDKVKEEKKENEPSKNSFKTDDDGNNDDEEELDDEEVSDSDASDEEDESSEEIDTKKKPKNKTDQALLEERVLFLRNISFDSTEESLKKAVEPYGKVTLALICKFKDSGHSKGTAFVHFSTADEAQKCLEACEDGKIYFDGRPINAILALPREKVEEIEKKKLTKVPKDNRNLRLLRFSLIREGTSAAKGMSKEDSDKRVKLAEAARKKLDNLHMFVSPVRIVVHNVPPKMTDEKLKQICKEAGGVGAWVNECRIWKEKSATDNTKLGRSKGFAFVSFTEHNHALACLQKLNNNENTFTKEKRPIVEFSIENLAALQAKERRKNGEDNKVSIKAVNEKVRKQIQESVGEIHASGMKFLPKFLGKKLRHRDMSKSQQKKLNIKKKDSGKGKDVKKSGGGVGKKDRKNKKAVTKYLALN